ncbi:MAG: SEC-C metal-binding domain-containing protein, partial [Bacillota bacterium]|nr:SEC-C metal-binding domain-containing protein [Bacillota bacterium]
MLNLFKIERNSPCECGSGRKYKRCCMGAVDELLSRWRREKIWP